MLNLRNWLHYIHQNPFQGENDKFDLRFILNAWRGVIGDHLIKSTCVPIDLGIYVVKELTPRDQPSMDIHEVLNGIWRKYGGPIVLVNNFC